MAPGVWQGATKLTFIDAMFTATSAVCVTGLIVVDTAQFSPIGHFILIVLMQVGGLGIVTTIILFLAGGGTTSLQQRRLLGDYFLPQIEYHPQKAVVKILAYAFIFEILGAIYLFMVLPSNPRVSRLMDAIFHSVSAFCNAGFSTNVNGLESFVGNPLIVLPFVSLVILGGLGFMVHDDIRRRILGKSKHLCLHSKIMIIATLVILLLGTFVYSLLEWNFAFAKFDLNPIQKIWEGFVASVMPRTAGFDTIAPAQHTTASSFFTMILMFIGGGPASTAGGLKITTFAILVLAIYRGVEANESLGFSRRKIATEAVAQAAMLLVRMVGFLALLLFILLYVESLPGASQGSLHVLAFETVSAFSTVGLSMGISSSLSIYGKIIIIFAMYFGRIGILALALPSNKTRKQKAYRLPDEEVMTG